MKDLRKDYKKSQLLEDNISDDPIAQFSLWFEDALSGGVLEPNACILSTLSQRGVDSRTILLKGVENDRFVFYTNYLSNKGQQLSANGECTLTFLWLEQERQIIIRGIASKNSPEDSDEYFNSRPRGSRIGAWVSSQSQPIADRESLEAILAQREKEFEGKEVSRPPHWGGYSIEPYEIEFWQGRPNRLHDRILYRKKGASWVIQRLQP